MEILSGKMEVMELDHMNKYLGRGREIFYIFFQQILVSGLQKFNRGIKNSTYGISDLGESFTEFSHN